MKKKLKNEKDKEETKQESSKTTGTEPIAVGTNTTSNTTSTPFIPTNKKVDKLSCEFPNEDLNKLVAKINQIIDKIND